MPGKCFITELHASLWRSLEKREEAKIARLQFLEGIVVKITFLDHRSCPGDRSQTLAAESTDLRSGSGTKTMEGES